MWFSCVVRTVFFTSLAVALFSACGGDKPAGKPKATPSVSAVVPTPAGPSPTPSRPGVPVNAAANLSFEDAEPHGGVIEGVVNVGRAADESDVTHYVLYWGSGAESKLADAQAIVVAPKTGKNLALALPDDTQIPENASHFIVFTKNAQGEMATGVSVALVDVGVPTHAAVSVGFTDTDKDANELAGNILIAKASNEEDLTGYVVYWASAMGLRLPGQAPLTVLEKTGENLSFSLPENTPKPENASRFLVVTRNEGGEMIGGVSQSIADNTENSELPGASPMAVTFADTQAAVSRLTGTVTIAKAANEQDITHYVLYFGTADTKLGEPLATRPKTGANVTFELTDRELSPSATHFLAFSKNKNGERVPGAALAIVDFKGPVPGPSVVASSIGFSDTNPNMNVLSGNVTIGKAADESNVTHYELYFGRNATTRLSNNPIQTKKKTGGNMTFTLTNLARPTGFPYASHLLVYAKNVAGISTGVRAHLIEESGAPAATTRPAGIDFVDGDADPNELAGAVTITKPASTANVTHYVLYWGLSSTDRIGSPIESIPLAGSGSTVTYFFGNNSPIQTLPNSTQKASHLLVFARNASGELATGRSVLISDVSSARPALGAASVSFSDTNNTRNTLGGNVRITKAANDLDVADYILYWGSSATAKLAGSAAIATFPRTGAASYLHSFAANTAIPAGASHLLVFTKNAIGERSPPTSVQLTDLTTAPPSSGAVSISFTDTDAAQARLGGNVVIAKATDETDIAQYVLYWGSSATAKLAARDAIATIARAGTATYTHTFANGTPRPAGATHLLVFTKNAVGENTANVRAFALTSAM